MVSRPPSMCCFPMCTCCQCFIARPGRSTLFKPSSMLGGSFASFCCESDSSSCSSFLWAKGCDLECRPRGYWRAGLKLFPAEAPSCSFISVPWGAPALLSLLLSLLDTRGMHSEIFWRIPPAPAFLQLSSCFAENVGLERMRNDVRLKIILYGPKCLSSCREKVPLVSLEGNALF